MRKGIVSQVFIYIFVVIVMALILFFGFKQVVNIKNLTDKSTYIAFKSDFSKDVNDAYYLNKGSILVFSEDSVNKELTLPKGIKRICFRDNKVILNSQEFDDFTVDYLTGDECINAVNGRLGFKLENIVENQEVKVRISNVGT